VKETEEDMVDAVEPESEETTETEKKERKPRKKKVPPAGRGWKRWLNYQAVVVQIPFFLFLTLLAVVYIYNGHLADKTVRQIGRTSREVKELQYEYKTVKSEVMFRSKQSEMVKAVEPLGLKELLQPPVILEEKKE
jgi:hypothetical protein